MRLKKIVKLLSIGVIAFVMTGCDGGGSSGNGLSVPPPLYQVKVNLIGTWDYATYTINSRCDGREVQGIEIIDSLRGNTSRIGDIIIEGEIFALDDYDNCSVAPIDMVTSVISGTNSTLTRDEFIDLRYRLNAWDDTVEAISVDGYTDARIKTSILYKNGVILTTILTR